ncbi:MAG: cytochrome c family protein [Acidobacteriota bacterium]|nr:cytochrome c family protein [Acidobacteriota bacterium]
MKITVVLIYSLVCCLIALSSYSTSHNLASQEPKPVEKKPDAQAPAAKQTLPGKLVFDDPGKRTEYASDKGKTDFDHAQHAAKDSCVICHHTNTEKLTAAVEQAVQKCTACHKQEETVCQTEGSREGKMFKGKKAMSAEDAFHGGARPGPYSLVGCIGCHQERDIKPKTCTTCHQK